MIEKPTEQLNDLTRRRDRVLATVDTAPEQAVLEARKLAEHICKAIYRQALEEDPGQNRMLAELVKKLDKAGLLPPEVCINLHTVRGFGNFGAHDQGQDPGEIHREAVQPCMAAVTYLVTWYCKSYLGQEPRAATDTQRNVRGRTVYSERFRVFLENDGEIDKEETQTLRDLGEGYGLATGEMQELEHEVRAQLAARARSEEERQAVERAEQARIEEQRRRQDAADRRQREQAEKREQRELAAQEKASEAQRRKSERSRKRQEERERKEQERRRKKEQEELASKELQRLREQGLAPESLLQRFKEPVLHDLRRVWRDAIVVSWTGYGLQLEYGIRKQEGGLLHWLYCWPSKITKPLVVGLGIRKWGTLAWQWKDASRESRDRGIWPILTAIARTPPLGLGCAIVMLIRIGVATLATLVALCPFLGLFPWLGHFWLRTRK